MTAAGITPERHEELAALLDDDGAALQAGYPQLADYLRTASSLAGSGDPSADNAFDIGILHYMTGGRSDNPYWDIVAPAISPSNKGDRREVNGGRERGSARLRLAQDLLQAAYAYPIPSPETLRWVATTCQGRPVVEIGAGSGYWAHLLAEHGVEVSAYDTHPPGDHTRNMWFPPIAGQPHLWHPVGGLRDLAAARQHARLAEREGEHVLFLCWPPAWGHPMARRALAAYERAGGDQLIYIGEPAGGVCADDEFFSALNTRWELADHHPDHVNWWNLNDVVQCWTRNQ